MPQRGFTLIEIIVIIGIITLLTSLLLLYSRGGERQILLLREKAKVISAVLRAKAMAINTVIEAQPACGFGVHFEERRYFIYRDSALDPRDCFAISDHRRYSGEASGEILASEIFPLDPALRFSGLPIGDVFFQPPQPRVFFDGEEPVSLREARLTLATLDNNSQASIIINDAGQITAE